MKEILLLWASPTTDDRPFDGVSGHRVGVSENIFNNGAFCIGLTTVMLYHVHSSSLKLNLWQCLQDETRYSNKEL